MKILITGFDPFGGESINPAWEAIKLIPNNLEGIELLKLQVPTVFKESIDVLLNTIKEQKPDAVICVGQAGGRFDITVERIAINLDDARIGDNKGYQPVDEVIYPNESPAYFSSLPIKAMVMKMKKTGVPSSVSNTAGTFVCNHIMYGLLHYIQNSNIRGGFIHVPFLPEQVLNKKNVPSMSLELIAKGLEASIIATYKYKEDLKIDGGLEF